MAPKEDASVLHDPSLLHPGLCVADVIYHPRKTKLMMQAEEAGCSTIGGLDMLLFQGAEAFRLWTGKQMPVEQVKERFFKL
jgi:shikimate dehydrogenase